MKRNNLIKLHVTLALCLMCIVSCIKEPSNGGIKSEVEIPGGAVNYFTKDMDFDFEGGTQVMAFKINIRWSMEQTNTQNGTKWLTIDPSQGNAGSNKVAFTAEENSTYEDRSVVVRFLTGDTVRNVKVNQKRLEAITLSSDVFEVPTSGDIITISIKHSMDYNYTIPENYKGWIHPITSTTRGLMHQSAVSFTIDPNEETEKREGKIYFTAGDKQEIITVYQAGGNKLVLSQNEYNLTAAAQTFNIDIRSNFEFNLEMPDVDWLKQSTSETRGMSSHTLKFEVAENDDYATRSAKIKITDKNSNLYETVTVNQVSNGAKIILAKSEFCVTSGAQDLDIDVKSNFDYNVDFQGANWIKQRKNNTRGITERLLKLSIDENKNKDARTATIKLYDKNSSAAELITVTQSAKSAIEVQTKQFSVDELKNIITVKVNANADYNLTPNNDWIHAGALTRGLNMNEHQFTIDALGDNIDREGSITVSNDDLKFSENITIKQRNTFYFENKYVEVLIGKEKALSVKNTTKQNVEWSSNKTDIATVATNGYVKGINRGIATITAKTTDGKHSATCEVKVCDITDMITIKSGGSVTKEGNLVKQGSQIKWGIKNNSPVKIQLKSMQLKGSSGEESNEYYPLEDIAAGSSVTKTTTIDTESGFHLPITCHFVFEYDSKEYPIDAEYK